MSGRGHERPQDRRERPEGPGGPADAGAAGPGQPRQPGGPSERPRECADCRLIGRLDPDPDRWPAWHRWRARALVAALADDAGNGSAEALIETDRDRLVVLVAYRRGHCGRARSAA